MNTLNSYAELIGRILLASLFLLAGLQKIGGYDATAGYMAAMGVPGALLPAVIALEVLGALAIIAGWQTRIAAFLLGGFSALSGLLFHANVADPMQATMLLKNFAVAGAFLLLVAQGAGPLSLDRRADR